TCRRHLQTLTLRGESKSTCKTLATIPKRRSVTADTRPRPSRSARMRWFAGTCRVCGRAFVAGLPGGTCSGACGDAHERAVRREVTHRSSVREVRSYLAPVDRYAIYRRENTKCWLCKGLWDQTAAAQSDDAPTFVYIIPLATYGSPVPGNVQSAHRLCNALRS